LQVAKLALFPVNEDSSLLNASCVVADAGWTAFKGTEQRGCSVA